MKKADNDTLTPGGMTERHLMVLHSALPQFKSDAKELEGLLSAMPRRNGKRCFETISHGHSYMNFPCCNICFYFMASFEALSVAEAAAKNSANPIEDILSALGEFQRSDTIDGNWKRGRRWIV